MQKNPTSLPSPQGVNVFQMNQVLGDKLGCTFDVLPTGSPDWVRVFVIRKSDGRTIGRLSFHNNFLYSTNFYKSKCPALKFGEMDESDRVQLKWAFWVATGEFLTDCDYDGLIFTAACMSMDDYKKRVAERKAIEAQDMATKGHVKRRKAIKPRAAITFVMMALRKKIEEVRG